MVEGGWTEQAPDEIKLMELTKHAEGHSLELCTAKALFLHKHLKVIILNFKIMLLIYS